MANIATIMSVCIAIYAIISPAAVSNYLREIAASGEKANAQLGAISENAAEISSDTNLLAAEIPFWIKTVYHHVSQSGTDDANYNLAIDNPTNFAIRDFSLKAVGKTGKVHQLAKSIVLPPNEGIAFSVEMNFDDIPHLICTSAYSERVGAKVYEMREVAIGERSSFMYFMTKGWDFTAKEPHEKCK